MKTTINILVSGLLLVLGNASAQNTLTVDNNPGAVAMFDNFADAYEAAEPGDTILLAGSPTSYGTHTIGKRLHLVGPGYNLGLHAVQQVNRNESKIRIRVEKEDGYDPGGSSFRGLVIGPNSPAISIVSTDLATVTFDRSWIVDGGVFESRVELTRCYSNGGLQIKAGPSRVESCILGGTINQYIWDASVDVIHSFMRVVPSGSGSLLMIRDSIILDDISQSSHGMNPNLFRCVISGTRAHQFEGFGVGTIIQPDFNSVVEIYTQDKFVLRADSVAKNAAPDGSDIGPTGGVRSYIPGGIGVLPRVTVFDAPSSVSSASGLQFQISAEAAKP